MSGHSKLPLRPLYNGAMIADNVAAQTVSSRDSGAVAKAATDIRSLILQRHLLPGEQVRQEDLARQLGTSRGPIREALQVLAAEGVLRYERHRGYFVTRFTSDEMRQLYVIRELLESEVLKSLPTVSDADITELRRINEQIRSGGDDLDAVVTLNKQFHDLIFEPSPLNVLKAELDHIGRMTTAYQSLSINALTDWELLADDHDKIIEALSAGDRDELVHMSRIHRDRSVARLIPILR
jgi:DNA-binding GntR family transcriptional regulator